MTQSLKVKRVIRSIARGGFGHVEEVELSNGDRAARKTFKPKIDLEREQIEKFRKRFEREVQVQLALPHDVVMPVLDYHLEEDEYWYLMPLAEKSYRAQIDDDRKAGRISVDPLLNILDALETLHNLGLVHRDLKPGNVLLHKGRWKLSDFGLVFMPDIGSSRLTSSSSVWGTEDYMAPEQSMALREVTLAADIYAFGCIIHDLVVGSERVPFDQYSCEGPLGAIIEKCTEEDPTRRFPSVYKLRDALLAAVTLSEMSKPDSQVVEWSQSLEDVSAWSVEKFEEFIRFLRRIGPQSPEASTLYTSIDEDAFLVLRDLDARLWGTMIEQYCDWAHGVSSPKFCDVLARRLNKIFELGMPNHKAAAALAAAHLGHSNNSLSVMHYVVSMCGPKLDEAAAGRIAMEIDIGGRYDDFINCVRGLRYKINRYHPIIANILGRAKAK